MSIFEPATFVLLSFIGAIAGLVGVYSATGLHGRQPGARRTPGLG